MAAVLFLSAAVGSLQLWGAAAGGSQLQVQRQALRDQIERDRLLLQRPLPVPVPRRMPFFALIHRDPAGWLAARGRGGGLALWRLAPDGNATVSNATVATMEPPAP